MTDHVPLVLNRYKDIETRILYEAKVHDRQNACEHEMSSHLEYPLIRRQKTVSKEAMVVQSSLGNPYTHTYIIYVHIWNPPGIITL